MGISDLKRKAVNGFFWSSLESIFSQGQGIIFGIFLARMLSPQEFGLIGMITIFISLAQVFVDSGLSQSLVRKQNCTSEDFSTIFWINNAIGLVAFLIIWISAPFISDFYSKSELINLTRVSAFTILIGSLTLIQQTIITKSIDFKTLTKYSTAATFISGVIAVFLAFRGFGVWSLVWRTVINQLVRSILLWFHTNWHPKFVLNKSILKEHFRFGSNILLISILASVYKSFYNLIIGKSYSDAILGYYTNADQYSTMPSSTLSSITNKVSYPVLSEMQDDHDRLRQSVRKLIMTVMYLSFVIMFGLAAISKPLFLLLFGEKWVPSVAIFQILCIAYAITPMHVINHNIMKIKGRSDLFLRTEILKYIIFTPLLILGAIFGMKVLIAGIVFFYWIGFLVNAMYSKKLLNYSAFRQIIDFLPVLTVALVSSIITWLIGFYLPLNTIGLLFIQGLLYVVMVLGLSAFFKMTAFLELRHILMNKFTFANILKTINRS